MEPGPAADRAVPAGDVGDDVGGAGAVVKVDLAPSPTLTTTRLGTVRAAPKLRLDAWRRGVPAGQAVSQLSALGSVTVTLSTTADTPTAGTPPRPVTWSRRLEAGPSLAAGAPTPNRVSSNRDGASGW